MNDVLQATRAKELRLLGLHELLDVLEFVKGLYAADWEIAYDLQRAEKLIQREMRALSAPEDEEEDGGGSLRIAAIKGERL